MINPSVSAFLACDCSSEVFCLSFIKPEAILENLPTAQRLIEHQEVLNIRYAAMNAVIQVCFHKTLDGPSLGMYSLTEQKGNVKTEWLSHVQTVENNQ